MLELPTELVQEIMGNLAYNRPTLMSSALVSPTFRDVCQQMLFVELTFPSILFCDQILLGARILPILKASPRIVSYIQSVSISDGPILQRNYRPVAASRLADDSDFAEVLNLLSLQGRVKNISFSDLRWSKLPSTTRNTICVLCRSRSIQTASIRTSPFQLTGLFGQSLKHLTISLSVSEFCSLLASSPLETATPPSQLQSLHISLCNFPGQSTLTNIVNFLLDPAATIGIHGLRDLYIKRGPMIGGGSDMYDPDAVKRLMSACGSSVETFAFEAHGNPIQQAALDLSLLTNLRKVSICWSDTGRIQGFVQIIEAVPLETPLEILHIHHATLQSYDPVEPIAESWANLDNACARLHEHGHLAKVVFDFPMPYVTALVAQDARDAIANALPRLRGLGILDLWVEAGDLRYDPMPPIKFLSH
ncbi:hypothetical protein FA15DRAFT_753339 [Coprinopsis marcescibilis]|uniref:F-box domain-containing protein n=1 Tax=Coprinopsis marcescibilis TaxID=230819 RepID=A0A5C3L6K2_COPMA|nr:hypothetical protein FA15DRAFT_753339 [Coprinopsis marcescibilis]